VCLHVLAVCACRAAWFSVVTFLGAALGQLNHQWTILLSTSASAMKSQHPSSCAAARCEIPATLEASTRKGQNLRHRNMHLFLCSDLLGSEEESLGRRVSREIKCKKHSSKKQLWRLVPELKLFPEKNFLRSIGIQSKEISMQKPTISLSLSISININIYIYKTNIY